MYKNNEFCIVIYLGVEKYIILKMCVFFEVFGNLGGILKYEINIIICILFVFNLWYNVLYEIMYKYLKYLVNVFCVLKME